MSYSITVPCGCSVYVSCHPTTGVAHTRVIQARGAKCRVRRHDIGARLYLWEILPEPIEASPPIQNDAHDGAPNRIRG